MAFTFSEEIQELFAAAEGGPTSRQLEDWLADASQGGSVFNNRPQYLRKWRAALAKVRAGTANAKAIFIGDSTTAGYSAVTNTSVRLKSYPAQVATLLSNIGIPAGSQSFWGDNNLPSGLAANDSRITSSGWAQSGLFTPGSGLSAGAAATLAFTPSVPVTTFDIYYVVNGVFSANIDGGAATNSTGAGFTVQKMTVSTTLGTHTLNLAWVSGTAYVLGVEAYNSAVKQVSCWNIANYGSLSTGWVGNTGAWETLKVISLSYQPDISFICLGINDVGNGLSLVTAKTNLQLLIDSCKTTGDVVLLSGVPSLPGQTQHTAAADRAYADMLAALALVNNCTFIDLNARWESYAVSNPLGLMSDALHPTTAGYADVAQPVVGALSSV